MMATNSTQQLAQTIRRRITMARKLTLPENISILGVPFRVRLYDGEEEGDNGDPEYGCTYGDLRLIQISEHQDTRRQWTTLLHEVVHAAFHVNGLGNKLDGTVEEVIAQTLEHALEQFLLAHGKQMLAALAVQSEEV